jgi:hypothetical protein
MQQIEVNAAEQTKAAIDKMSKRVSERLMLMAQCFKDGMVEIDAAFSEFRDGMTERAIERQGQIQALIEETGAMINAAVEKFNGLPSERKPDPEREHRKRAAREAIKTIVASPPAMPQISNATEMLQLESSHD